MAVFGEGAFKKVMKVKWGHEGGALIPQDWCLIRRARVTGVLGLSPHTQRKAPQGSQEAELSADRRSAHTLILDLQPVELQENRCLPCQLPRLWHFVMVAP